VKVGKDDKMDVYLEPASASLNEVVVTGYGAQRKKNVTGSVAAIQENRIIPNKSVNILNGKVAGVMVMQYDKLLLHKDMFIPAVDSR